MKPEKPSKKVTASAAPIPAPVAAAPLSKQEEKKKYYLSYLINLWIFFPALFYFNLVNKYAVNFPYQDDYNAVLEFLTKYKLAALGDKLTLLFSQHGDHRLLHSRLIYVGYHALFGKINFAHLIFIGNLQLLVIFIILVHFIRKAIPRYWNFVSLVAGFCLFDPSGYENADFAMSGIQNYGVIMLFMISLYLFSKTGNKLLILAGLTEVIMMFSSGNGFLCAIMITLYLVFSRQRNKYIVSGAIAVVCEALYYVNYVKAQNMGELHEAFSLTRLTHFYFHMLGSHFSFDNGIPIGVAVSVLMIVLLPISMKLKFKENALPLVCIFGAFVATATAISVFRNSVELGEIAAYSGRYRIYSHVITAFLFIFLWIKLDGTKFLWPAVVVGALVALYPYKENYEYGNSCMDMIRRRLENTEYYYGNHKPEANAKAKVIEQEACKLGIYCIQDER